MRGRDLLLLGKRIARPSPSPFFFPVAGRARGALHWGPRRRAPAALRAQCGLTPHFGGRPAPAKMFRSLLRQWLGTTTGKKSRGAVGLRREPAPLAIRLGAQRGLRALHLVAAQITVDRRWPPLAPRHCLALATAGARDALCFDRHIPPLHRHAGIIENLRDGRQAPLPPLPPPSWRSCVLIVEGRVAPGRGARYVLRGAKNRRRCAWMARGGKLRTGESAASLFGPLDGICLNRHNQLNWRIADIAMKHLVWVGSTVKDVGKFPQDVQDVVVSALDEAKEGGKHQDAKPLRGFTGAGVLEVVDDYDGDTYRAVYTVRLSEAIYVLHAFKKKSTKGIKTTTRDIELIKTRLKAAEEHNAGLKAQAAKEQKHGGGPR